MSTPKLLVLKFGSSVLRSEADLPRVAAEIRRHVDEGWHVVAVVSAIGKSTEELIGRARKLGHGIGDPVLSPKAGANPSAVDDTTKAPSSAPAAEAAFAALLATGEATSAALVGLALDNVGVPFTVLCAGRVGPFTRGPQLDARPHAFNADSVKRALARRPVAILPGFVGHDGEGDFSLLGRGGSDLTALFVSHSLGADRCRLLKDVDGIYEHDPATRGGRKPRRYESLDWAGALRLEDCVVQRRAAQFAYRHRLPFEVGACGDLPATRVGAEDTRLAAAGNGRPARARVATTHSRGASRARVATTHTHRGGASRARVAAADSGGAPRAPVAGGKNGEASPTCAAGVRPATAEGGLSS